MTGPAKSAPGRKGLWKEIGKRLLPSLRYISSTEVHAYAFSIAANTYLCFFPFTLLLLTVCRRWLGWESATRMILELLQIHLPKGADSILRNLSQLAADVQDCNSFRCSCSSSPVQVFSCRWK